MSIKLMLTPTCSICGMREIMREELSMVGVEMPDGTEFRVCRACLERSLNEQSNFKRKNDKRRRG